MEFRVSMAMLAVVGLMFSAMGSSEGRYFYVGGDDGWGPNPSENFNHWAERNRFQINDTLVFRYTKGEDSVLLVKEANYYSCKTSNPFEYHSSGSTVIELGRSGPFFFTSGVHGRCKKGQKMIVVVLSPRRNVTISSSPSPAPSPIHALSPAAPLPAAAPSPASPTAAAPSPAFSPTPASIAVVPSAAPSPATLPAASSAPPSVGRSFMPDALVLLAGLPLFI